MAKLTDENEALDVSAKKKKPIALIIGFAVCFLLSVGASAGITFWLTSSQNNSQQLTTLQSQLDTQLSAMRQSIEQQNTTLSAMRGENETLRTYLRHSSADSIKNIMINQEENIQAYLSVMRQAIGDLAEIVPRSTEWETTYQYQMDLALKSSMERASLLRLLKTGEPPKPSDAVPAQSPSTNN
ncbi:hypothetical protein [Marinomonas ostreistagni]|uniref:hypothetical protein n=1 Tax=Marinomonas ostreistagni TaxID=359209 RepID=UPI00194FEDB4|nr:hypothetical protein [Marinomonas ostreistagni]MBM6551683.1 hypothetical protein [Marinomonas ostreistagni]